MKNVITNELSNHIKLMNNIRYMKNNDILDVETKDLYVNIIYKHFDVSVIILDNIFYITFSNISNEDYNPSILLSELYLNGLHTVISFNKVLENKDKNKPKIHKYRNEEYRVFDSEALKFLYRLKKDIELISYNYIRTI